MKLFLHCHATRMISVGRGSLRNIMKRRPIIIHLPPKPISNMLIQIEHIHGRMPMIYQSIIPYHKTLLQKSITTSQPKQTPRISNLPLQALVMQTPSVLPAIIRACFGSIPNDVLSHHFRLDKGVSLPFILMEFKAPSILPKTG